MIKKGQLRIASSPERKIYQTILILTEGMYPDRKTCYIIEECEDRVRTYWTWISDYRLENETKVIFDPK